MCGSFLWLVGVAVVGFDRWRCCLCGWWRAAAVEDDAVAGWCRGCSSALVLSLWDVGLGGVRDRCLRGGVGVRGLGSNSM